MSDLVDWALIAAQLSSVYASSNGEAAWPLMAILKTMFLAVWYDGSDVRLGEALEDRAAFMRFRNALVARCALTLRTVAVGAPAVRTVLTGLHMAAEGSRPAQSDCRQDAALHPTERVVMGLSVGKALVAEEIR